ncbi:MAG: molybdopterin-dependent oxidoreductase [Eggerthellaceae bacterium]|jgi:anaerobic selenocysteine-containing dehydrogenase
MALKEGESFVYTACPGWGDHDYCALKTIVKDGKIVRMEPVEYTGPESDEGHICQKGCLGGRQPYDPTRLKKPLKRAGERGEGKWEEISWEQALDEIAGKLNAIKAEHGPESVTLWNLRAGVPPAYSFEALMPERFGNAFGCTCPMESIGLDNGPFYTEFYSVGTTAQHVLIDPKVMVGTDLIYVWGCNPIENQMRFAQNLVKAREAGAKIIDIGLIFDGTAGFADEFYGIKPSTDGDLAAGMINYILEHGLEDDDYLIDRSIAAYLVRDDDGTLARDKNGNFIVYDNDAKSLMTVAPARGDYSSTNLALTGHFDWNGIGLTPVFQLMKQQYAPYTLEAVSEKTGLPTHVIAKLAEDWARADKAFIVSGYGLRYHNTNETYRMQHLLGILTGRFSQPGSGVIEGLQLQGYPLNFNDTAITLPDGTLASVKSNPVRMANWFAQAEADDSPYRALLVAGGNPVHQQPDRQRWLDIISHMDLVVDYDIWMTDTGELADYVLPDCMPFEREDLITGACYNHLVLQEPAIEPPAGCEPHEPVWVWSQLAKRVGLGDYFDKTIPEWIDVRLNTDFPLVANIQPKVTYERLKKEKMIRAAVPTFPWNPWMNPKEVFPNATGRFEIYAERLLKHGLAFPHPIEPNYVGKFPEYPFQLFTGRQRFFMQSSFTDDPVTVELSGGTPSTRINPIDARALDLKDGDKVEVYNGRGHVVTRLEIDECVPAGTVHVWFGWRRRQFEEGTYAEMVHQCPNLDSQTEVEDTWWNDWLAAGHIGNSWVEFMATEIGGTDCYWDSVCNIRKYEQA